ncbi:unnamed protein product, partial [Amoebophrya sp. A120]
AVRNARSVCKKGAVMDANRGKATVARSVLQEDGSSYSGSPLETAAIGFFRDASTAASEQAKFERLPGYIRPKNEVHVKVTKQEVEALSRSPARTGTGRDRVKIMTREEIESEVETVRKLFERAGVRVADAGDEDINSFHPGNKTAGAYFHLRRVYELNPKQARDWGLARPAGPFYPPRQPFHGSNIGSPSSGSCIYADPAQGKDQCLAVPDPLVAVVSLEAPGYACAGPDMLPKGNEFHPEGIPHATLSGPLLDRNYKDGAASSSDVPFLQRQRQAVAIVNRAISELD